jgi:hypothetical protein
MWRDLIPCLMIWGHDAPRKDGARCPADFKPQSPIPPDRKTAAGRRHCACQAFLAKHEIGYILFHAKFQEKF